MPDKAFVGIDIAKLKFDVAVWLGNTKYKTKVFPNTLNGFKELSLWLKPYPLCHMCLEATGVYGAALATYLSDNGFIVSIVNPAQINSFGKSELIRNKTDKLDSKLIARYCASQLPPVWKPAPLSERQLLALVRRLNNLTELLLMEENRLSVADEVVHSSIIEIIKALRLQISETKSKIKSHINSNHDLKKNKKLLESIPGVGAILSATLLAYIGDG